MALEAEGGAEASKSRATPLRKNKRLAIKEVGGAAYEDALKKNSKRKRLAPIQGVEPSDEGALQWYRQAADQGYAAAQFCLGFAYKYGEGVKQSNEEAVRWYRQAAEQGDAAAQFCLGNAYKYGEDVKQSDEEAGRTVVPTGRGPRQGRCAVLPGSRL